MEPDLEATFISSPRRGIRHDDALLDADTVITKSAPSVPRDASIRQSPAAEAPATAPQQALASYRFQVNQHEPITLDRPALIGRRPALPRVPQPTRPRLVRVPSPLGEVSSNHVEIRQRGQSVVVTDLRSTNGTSVVLPGSVPRALHPGESLVVTPGSLVDIGDGNRIEILPLQRLRQSDTHATAGRQQ